MKDTKGKLNTPHDFFDALHFGILNIEKIYSKIYGSSPNEGNLFERHTTVLKSIPIKFTIETIMK